MTNAQKTFLAILILNLAVSGTLPNTAHTVEAPNQPFAQLIRSAKIYVRQDSIIVTGNDGDSDDLDSEKVSITQHAFDVTALPDSAFGDHETR